MDLPDLRVGQESDRRIRTPFDEVFDPLIHHALSDPEEFEDPGDNHLADSQFFSQVRQDAMLHEVAHFMGDPRHGYDGFPVLLGYETGRGAHRVFDGDRSFGDVSLLPVVIAHRSSQPPEEVADLLKKAGLKHKGPVQDFRHSFPGQVVQGRPDSAGGNDKIRPAQSGSQGALDPFQVVSHRALEMQVQAHGGQLLGDVGRVGVHDLAQQQLRSHGNDFCFHFFLSLYLLGHR
jgi:hypothetical protein